MTAAGVVRVALRTPPVLAGAGRDGPFWVEIVAVGSKKEENISGEFRPASHPVSCGRLPSGFNACRF